MEALTPWLTPALLVALFTWLRRDMGELRRDVRDMNRRFDGVNERFDEANKRFDVITRELADLRERTAKLDGFLAGRRDRDVA